MLPHPKTSLAPGSVFAHFEGKESRHIHHLCSLITPKLNAAAALPRKRLGAPLALFGRVHKHVIWVLDQRKRRARMALMPAWLFGAFASKCL
jgi:hypothetical protein